MSKKILFLGLLGCLVVSISPLSSGPARAQSRSPVKLVIKVSLKDKDQSSHLVQNLGLLVQRKNSDAAGTIVSSLRVKTTSDGSVSVAVLPGDYIVKSESPLVVDAKAYEWSVNLKVEFGAGTSLELSNDNATITQADAALKEGRITGEADLLGVLRDGVVNIQGELGQGTGFIADISGLILTNQHLISKSRELRVQFDHGRKVMAKLLVEDADKDLAVLHVNLAACPSCKSLMLAEPKPGAKMPAVAGTRVFAISSPLGGEKTLTAGTIVKANGQSGIMDMTIDVSKSGAPLFNSEGEVIGLLRFVDQGMKPDAAKKIVAQGRIESSGIIRVEEACDLLAKARQVAKETPASPSAELLPTEPDDFFPTGALKNRVDIKSFRSKPYETEVGKYQLTMITPALKYYVMEKDRTELERQQAKEAKKNKSSPPSQEPVATYSFRNFRNWADYVSQMRPVVHLLAIPEVKATGKSIFLGVLTAGVLAAGGGVPIFALDYKFKADFKEMLLTCDGKPVIPIQRGRIEFVAPLRSYYKIENRYAYAGLYTYAIETFDPGRCKQLSLQVVSEEKAITPENKLIYPKMVQKVWDDFEAYRRQSAGRK